MKSIMKKFFSKRVFITFLIMCFGIAGCSPASSSEEEQISDTAFVSEQQIAPMAEFDTISIAKNTQANEELSSSIKFTRQLPDELEDLPYRYGSYHRTLHENSKIYIEYPIFYNTDNKDELNALILRTVQSFVTALDPQCSPREGKYVLYYHAKVTRQTSYAISIVFWGTTDIESNAFPISTLHTLNIDAKTLDIISLTDLYNLDVYFKNTFFEKCFFPSVPVTNYEENIFSYMLSLQTDEYCAISAFDFPETISFYLVPEGIVLSLPASHAYGDRFEAEVLYSDLEENYVGKYNLNLD